MTKLKYCLLFFSLPLVGVAQVKYDSTLASVLENIYDEDQKYRLQLSDIESKYGYRSKEMDDQWDLIKQKDDENLVIVKEILNSSGWLGKEEIGVKANMALFLVIQHGDFETQKMFVPVMRDAVLRSKAKAGNLALLEDRLALKEGRGQIYGSQIIRFDDLGYQVSPLLDPSKVDERRAEVGLGTLQEYISNWNMEWDLEEYLKILPELEKRQKMISYPD